MNSLVKKAALATALSFILPSTAMADIIITEYVEGSSNNKALEITNRGSEAVDMGAEHYKLAMYSNGSTTEHEDRKIDLEGSLAAGASYVVYNANADAEFQFPDAGASSEVTFFNGDDVIVLVRGDVIMDSIGRIGEDPGSEWTDPNNPDFSTKEKTLRRMDNVTAGDDVADDEFPGSVNQWVVFDQNTSDGLGCDGETACGEAATESLLITEYIEGSSNNKAVEITNMSSEAIDMGAGNYKLAMFSNGSETEHESRKIEFTGILEAGASYVVYNASADAEFQFPDSGSDSEVTFFNGDDALVLTRDGVVIDSFGRVGEDPGSEWTDVNNADFSTKEKTLRRMASVTTGDTVVDDEFPGSNNQWVVFDQNTSDGLGCSGESACAGGGDTHNENIMITEYVEGSSNNKAIEITNMGSEAVDMTAGNYKLAMFSNGDTTEHDTRKILLSGMLEAGASYVIYNASADAEFLFPDQGAESEVTFFNGDDALVLTRDGVVMDSFGRVGEDPGSEWLDPNNADFSTKEKTLRRKADITSGDTTVDDEFPGSNNQWLAFDQNTSDGLGCSGEVACSGGGDGGGDTVTENIMITEYVEGSSNNKAVEITNMGSEAVDMGAGNYKLAMFSNGSTTEHEERKILLTGLLEAGASYVVYNANAAPEFLFPEQGAESEVTFFNGDDTLVLTRDGVVMDSFGRVGEDPGSEWLDPNDANFSSKEKTLRRKASVTSGDTVVDDEFPGSPNEWVAFDADTADGLGCSGETACGSTGGGDGGGGGTGGTDIMITEYVEGSSNNKALEISNMTDTAIDMGAGNYRLAMYSNGDATEHDSRKISLTGMLEPGASFVVYNANADAEFQFPDQGAVSELTFFNGNDTLVLVKNDVIIDSIGRIGEDPGGDGWLDANDANFSTKEKTLRRLNSVVAGDAVADDAFPGETNEWLTFGQNTSDGLGCPGGGACTGGGGGGGEVPEPVENFVLITEYVEGTNSNKVIELSNIGTEDVDLFTAGYQLAAYNNGNTSVSNSLNLFGVLVPGSSIVIYNRDAEEQFHREAPQGIGSNVTFFNGDDALVLTLNGVIVDSLGQVGFRPNGEWTDPNDPSFGTFDKTLRRKASVTVGDHIVNNTFPGDTNEWVTFDLDTADGLGCMGEGACTGSEPTPLASQGGGVAIGGCTNCPEISKVADAQAYEESVYYEAALAAAPADLAAAVNQIISNRHIKVTYSQAWSVLSFADEDPDNTDNIIEIYTGNSVAKLFNGSGANQNDQDSWNREHVWAKSHGFPDDSQWGYTDTHHLRAADWSMNTLRSNLDFDNGGDPVEESPINFKDSDSWEPRDEVKGDIARTMFYMASRYDGAANDRTPDLVLVDYTGTASGSAEFGKLCTLWEWHKADPVSAAEMNRNNVVYEWQGNRNPFVDRPDWADEIYGDPCRPHTAPVIDMSGPTLVDEGESVSINASGSFDPDGDSISYHWVQLTDAHISFEFDAEVLTFIAPKVDTDTPITFMLTITDGEFEVSHEYTLTVEDTTTNSGAGGSIGWITLLLLPLVGMRRRKHTLH